MQYMLMYIRRHNCGHPYHPFNKVGRYKVGMLELNTGRLEINFGKYVWTQFRNQLPDYLGQKNEIHSKLGREKILHEGRKGDRVLET